MRRRIQAAALLNVSRPFLVSMIGRGVLPARKAGKHRRWRLSDALEHKAGQFTRREQTLDEIAAFGQEFGLK